MNDDLPEFLKLTAEQRKAAWGRIDVISKSGEVTDTKTAEVAAYAERLDARERRRIKAELVRLRERLAACQRRNEPKALIKKVEEAIKRAETDLLMVS